MPTLRPLLSWLVPIATVIALLWSVTVHPAPRRRRVLLREEDMTDWLLRDIGWKDGRDMSAWREARMAERRWF